MAIFCVYKFEKSTWAVDCYIVVIVLPGKCLIIDSCLCYNNRVAFE
jgi:hypothetical protein